MIFVLLCVIKLGTGLKVSLSAIITKLHEFYGPVARPPRDLFAFFVWEVISPDVLPARRDLAWHALRRIPALTPDAMFRTKPKTLADALSPIGSNRSERIETLREGLAPFRRQRDLENRVERPVSLLDAVRALTQVSPFDRAARHRALLFVSGCHVLPVDRGVARVGARLGLAASDRVGDVRRALMRLLPSDTNAYEEAAIYLSHHATHACTAAAPHCAVCPLRDGCPAAR